MWWSLRGGEAAKQVLRRHVRERVEEEVGSRGVETELARDLVRDGDGEDPGRFRGADAVRRVLEGDRFFRLHAEEAERLEVEGRGRLRAHRVAVGGADRVPG